MMKQAARGLWRQPRNHRLLLAALSMLAGCVACTYLEPGIWLWALGLTALLSGVLLHLAGKQAGLALALCFFLLGVMRTSISLNVPQPTPGRYEVSGAVYGRVRQRSEDSLAFALADITLDGLPVEGRAYVTLHYGEECPQLYDGAQLCFSGRVYLPEGRSGATHMDFRLWMRQNGMRFGISTYDQVQVSNTPETAPVMDWAFRLRNRLEESLHRVMGDSARVAMSMLFSQTWGLAEEEYKAFQTLGIAHILSVSGLHIGMLAAMVASLLRRLSLRQWVILLIQTLLLAGYCALAGFSAASLRAMVMLTAYSLARLLGRNPDRLTTLALAMLVLLILNPLQAFSAGFVLSFTAMLGLCLFAVPLGETAKRLLPDLPYQPDHPSRLRNLRVRLRCSLRQSLAYSLAAQTGVLLPTAAYFHQLPLYGVAINLVITPLATTVLMPLYALMFPISLVPGIGPVMGAAAAWGTERFLELVLLLSRLPYAAIRVASPSAAVCIGLGLSLVLLSRRVPGSFPRRALASVLCLAITLAGAWVSRPPSLRYIQLSVGQADAALLLDGEKTILIDAGDDGRAAADILLAEGRSVDALIITHLHMDHMGGTAYLLDAGIPIRQVYLPAHAQHQQADPQALAILERLRSAGICISELAQGDELRYNESTLRVLWPDQAAARGGYDANDMCLTLAIDFGGYTLLSTGDLTTHYELYAAAPADVLKVAHHGSAKSTSTAFLQAVQPRLALLSCSGGSAYLPSAKTLKRLQGIPVLRTDECGDITLTVRDGQLVAAPYRERKTQ